MKEHSHFQHLLPWWTLSNLTYLPEACKAHGTGLGLVQKVPICTNLFQDRFSERLDFFFALSLTAIVGAMYVRCTEPAAKAKSRCLQPPEHTHTHTLLHLLVLSCAHTHRQTKGRNRDQRKSKWPARVLMRDGRASGIYLKPFLPPAALSEGFKSAAR